SKSMTANSSKLLSVCSGLLIRAEFDKGLLTYSQVNKVIFYQKSAIKPLAQKFIYNDYLKNK
ncbi:hypothetical protein QT621_26435, partial [Xanthomonas citri pv. citri]